MTQSFHRARTDEHRSVRREAILSTTASMLKEMSVGALTLNDVGRRTGMAKSNVLRYFESREAILLELLNRSWQAYTIDVALELKGRINLSEAPADRVRAVAAVLTDTFNTHAIFCDLLNAQASVLEHNISTPVAARYKRATMKSIDDLATSLLAYLPEIGDGAQQLAGVVSVLAGTLWTHTHPSPSMLAAYRSEPDLGAVQASFAEVLRPTLVALLLGTIRIWEQ